MLKLKFAHMQHLEDFFSYLQGLESQKEIVDVLELLPYFESLELHNWPALLDRENGKPCTTILYQSELVKMSLIYCVITSYSIHYRKLYEVYSSPLKYRYACLTPNRSK